MLHLFFLLYFFTSLLAVLEAYLAWQRRHVQGATLVGWVMMALAVWAFTDAMILISDNWGEALFWAKVGYIGIHAVPPLLWMLSRLYAQRPAPRWSRVLVGVIPAVTVGLAFTNESHHLIWRSFVPGTLSPAIPVPRYGPWFWVGAIYDYLLLAAGTLELLLAWRRLTASSRRQVGIILIAYLLPWGANLLHVFRLLPYPELEPEPMVFLLSGAVVLYGIFGAQLLNLGPLARDTLMDVMEDIVLVLHHDGLLVDFNRSARQKLGLERSGQPVEQALASWPELVALLQQGVAALRGPRTLTTLDGRTYEVRGYPLKTQGRSAGWVVLLRDISRQKAFEEALKTSEALYRAISESSSRGIAVVQDGVVRFCNARLAFLVGRSKKEIEGTRADALFAFQQAAPVPVNRAEGEVSTRPLRYRVEIQHASGALIPMEVELVDIRYAGRPALLVFAQDLREQIQREQALQQRARQEELLNEIVQAALQPVSLEATLEVLATRLGELFGADGCFITLWDAERERPIPMAAHGVGVTSEKYRALDGEPQSAAFTRAALEHGRVLTIEEVPRPPDIHPAQAALFPIRSLLALPLMADGEKLGAALVAFSSPRRFTEEEVALGERARYLISLAVLKVKLLERVTRWAMEAETLRQAGLAVTASLRLEDTIRRILQQLRKVVPYDSATVLWLRDESLEVVGIYGKGERERLLGVQIPLRPEIPLTRVIRTRKPYILPDTQAFRGQHPARQSCAHVRSWVGVPLVLQSRVIGMISLESTRPHHFTAEHVRLAMGFAAHVAIALHNAHLYERTRHQAITDPLTGLYNRRYFMELAHREHRQALREGASLAILMLDLDHFKRVNDTYGHLVGDQALRAVALLCQDHLRQTDIIGRYGGEEFIVLLPATRIHAEDIAHRIAERLRRAIASTPIRTPQGEVRLTVSIGAATLSEAGEALDVLIQRADQALYLAKQQGRNRVVVWSEAQRALPPDSDSSPFEGPVLDEGEAFEDPPQDASD